MTSRSRARRRPPDPRTKTPVLQRFFRGLLFILSGMVLMLVVILIGAYAYLQHRFATSEVPRTALVILDQVPATEATQLVLFQQTGRQLSRTELTAESLDLLSSERLTELKMQPHDQADTAQIKRELQVLVGLHLRVAIESHVDWPASQLQSLRSDTRWQLLIQSAAAGAFDSGIRLWQLLEMPVLQVDVLQAPTDQLSASLEPIPVESQAACTVAVQNATAVSGLAGSIAQLLEAHGVRVIQVDDAPPNSMTEVVRAPNLDPSCEVVERLLMGVLPTQGMVRDDQPAVERARAQFVLTLGPEYEAMLLPE